MMRRLRPPTANHTYVGVALAEDVGVALDVGAFDVALAVPAAGDVEVWGEGKACT